MFRYLILFLIFVSSVCDAHKYDGVWHEGSIATRGQLPHSHHRVLDQRELDQALQPRTVVTVIADDTTAQDDAAVPAASLASVPPQVVITAEPLIITEYMRRDWSRAGGGGLPQWIELYNPNAEPMPLDGYQFTHAYRRFANGPWVYVTTSITGLTIPASDAALIANRSVRTGSQYMRGISNKDVWTIPYAEERAQLKNGWHLTNPNGRLVHRIGTVFREYPADAPSDWDSSLRVPELPSHTSEGYRVSYQVSPSGDPGGEHFYGSENDVGSPGFYEAAPAAPAAPSLQRPKLTTTWGHLKRAK